MPAPALLTANTLAGSHVPAPPLPRLGHAWRTLEHGFDSVFGARDNPLKQLGALGVWLLTLLLISGCLLYVVLDTSAAGAYPSIAALDAWPWRLGSALRGLHRYGADAFMLVMGLHLVREWLLGRFRYWRRAIWWTGVPLVGLAFVSAIGGFWLNWDRLGQYSAEATAQWLDALPFLASPLARNFLLDQSLNDRLFTLFVFIHIGVPLLLVFGLWFHLQRISLAQVFPTRRLAWGMLLTLLLLALLAPVRSQGMAQLSSQSAALALDWWLLFIHPLVDATSPATGWALVLLGFAALALAPLWPSPARQPVAQVYPEHCSGCQRCLADCPYSAISMVPHPNGKAGAQLAQVRADLCASCGICAGSCPSSTPFRSAAQLVTGIDMPQWPVDALRAQLLQGLRDLPGPGRYLVLGCAQGAQPRQLAPDTLLLPLVCAGALPPAFIEYALRHGVDGVLVSGCRPGGCEFRLGQRWSAERLAGTRAPQLRRSAARERLHMAWLDCGDEAALATALERLRQQCPAGCGAAQPTLESLESPPSPPAPPQETPA